MKGGLPSPPCVGVIVLFQGLLDREGNCPDWSRAENFPEDSARVADVLSRIAL